MTTSPEPSLYLWFGCGIGIQSRTSQQSASVGSGIFGLEGIEAEGSRDRDAAACSRDCTSPFEEAMVVFSRPRKEREDAALPKDGGK